MSLTTGLMNARLMGRRHPDTFELPPEHHLSGIAPGCFAKICRHHERFWVIVEATDGATIVGAVNNQLMLRANADLPIGALVRFARHHVLDLLPPLEESHGRSAV